MQATDVSAVIRIFLVGVLLLLHGIQVALPENVSLNNWSDDDLTMHRNVYTSGGDQNQEEDPVPLYTRDSPNLPPIRVDVGRDAAGGLPRSQCHGGGRTVLRIRAYRRFNDEGSLDERVLPTVLVKRVKLLRERYRQQTLRCPNDPLNHDSIPALHILNVCSDDRDDRHGPTLFRIRGT
eukprot:1080849-Amorphochlora_amoeboformis.AAC.3